MYALFIALSLGICGGMAWHTFTHKFAHGIIHTMLEYARKFTLSFTPTSHITSHRIALNHIECWLLHHHSPHQSPTNWNEYTERECYTQTRTSTHHTPGLLRLQQIYQGLRPNESFQVETVKRIANVSNAINFLRTLETLNRWSRKFIVLDCPTEMAKEIIINQ